MKVTWASMGGVVTATALPLRIGTIRPGSSQAITLIFRYLSAGPAAFKIDGTCSFGYFGTVQDVAAPQLHVPTRHETQALADHDQPFRRRSSYDGGPVLAH